MEMDNRIYEEIVDLCEIGDTYFERGEMDLAIEKYASALELVPLPKKDWDTSTWIYTALGDAYFFNTDYERAKSNLYDAINCPEGSSNPFVLMRLGQSLFECGEFDKAKEYLLRGFLIEGYSLFYSEEDKYFDLIKDII